MQVGDACAASSQCFFLRLEERAASLRALHEMPGVPAATRALGYASFADFSQDALMALEATFLFSTFCLMPPGDTPKRRAFFDAIVFGCAAPVLIGSLPRFGTQFALIHIHMRWPVLPVHQAASAMKQSCMLRFCTFIQKVMLHH